MRRRRQALPCVLATALFLLPHPGSCPLLKGLQSAECRHAFFAVCASPASLAGPLDRGKVRAGEKRAAPTWLSRGGIRAFGAGWLRSSLSHDSPRRRTFVSRDLDWQHNQVVVPGTHRPKSQTFDDRDSLAE